MRYIMIHFYCCFSFIYCFPQWQQTELSFSSQTSLILSRDIQEHSPPETGASLTHSYPEYCHDKTNYESYCHCHIRYIIGIGNLCDEIVELC